MHQAIVNLRRAVTRLVTAERAEALILVESQQDYHLAIIQELDNSRTNYQAKLRLVDELIPEGPPIPVFPDGS